MHSKIYQISETPIEREDYITASDFYDESNWCDYTRDMDEKEEKECLDYLPELLKDVCEVNGREITVKNVESFIKEWKEKIVESAQKDGYLGTYLFNVQNICKRTHKEIWSRFYLEDWSENADTFGDFVEYLHHLGEGAKLYVGGVVDYHF